MWEREKGPIYDAYQRRDSVGGTGKQAVDPVSSAVIYFIICAEQLMTANGKLNYRQQ